MSVSCLVIRPDYSGEPRRQLLRLAAGIAELTTALTGNDVPVHSVRTTTVGRIWNELTERMKGEEPLIVYVGGHGQVDCAAEHYTALEGTPANPGSLNALWTRQLALELTKTNREAVLFVDTCFSGASTMALNEALNVLASSPTARSFGLVAVCRAFETTEDGVFVESLLRLIRDGPRSNITAWTPNDKAIRLGALVAELKGAGVPVKEVMADGASELRVVPNLANDPTEPEGRVEVKLRLRQISSGADSHLLTKSEGFVGRVALRTEIAQWLTTARHGMFVITGGPGTGKSALMGLLARQSVGEAWARALEPCIDYEAFDVVVHARQKTLQQVEIEIPSSIGDRRCTVLVDALDEAVTGQSIGIAAHLRALSRCRSVRLVVGSRSSPLMSTTVGGKDPLISELSPAELRNLDHTENTQDDIAQLLRAILADQAGSPYRSREVTDLVSEVAAQTTPSFLFAQAAARWLTAQPAAITDYDDWRVRVAGLANHDALGSLIDDDLVARFKGDDLQRVREILCALAWAEGLGLPRYTIWPTLAEVLSPTARRYNDPDITWALKSAGWYITEAGEDGQTVYRLFHQMLAESLRRETKHGH